MSLLWFVSLMRVTGAAPALGAADPCDTFAVRADPPAFALSADIGAFRVPGCG